MKNKIIYLLLALLTTTLSAFAVSVNLDFYADGKLIHSVEVAAGSTYTLSTYVDGDTVSACRGWDFAGWTLDAPIEGTSDVKPCFVTSVTPAANMNIYGVYRKSKGTEYRYIKISSQSELVTGDYIITYEDDGKNYYALGMTEYLYYSGDSKYYYAINSKYISDVTCDYSEIYGSQPDSLIWRYTKSSDYQGTWRNTSNSKYLKPDSTQSGNWYSGYTYNFKLLSNSSANVVTKYYADNGLFYMYIGDNNLVYNSNEFICWHSGYVYPEFCLFKKTLVTAYDYTSYPNCSKWSTYLDAGLGTIEGTDPAASKSKVTEGTPGATVSLPDATQGDEFNCGDWSFHGWHRDTPVESTSSAPTVYSGSGYSISHDGEQLYAVYTKTVEYIHYEQISSLSELSNGDTCLIVYAGNSCAITYNNSNTSWSGTLVSIMDGEIGIAGLASSMKWTYNKSSNYFSNTSHLLAYNGSTSQAYNPVDQGSSIFIFQNKGYTNYKLRWSGSNFSESTTNSQNTFKIFVRKTTAATYTSFPHCRPYSVTLHAGSGTIDAAGSPETLIKTEDNAGEGFELPDAIPGCDEQGWSFVGWVEGDAVASMRQTTFTERDGLITDNPYVPTKNGAHLYAVYARLSDYFRLIAYPENMVVGDNYILTYYTKVTGDETDNMWDIELSSEVVNTNYLAGVPKDAPQDAVGYYMIATDSAVIWKLGQDDTEWTFQNIKTNKYLAFSRSSSSVYTVSADDYNSSTDDAFFNISRPSSTHNIIFKSYYENKYLYYDGEKYVASSTEKSDSYIYRQMREYATYPRCERFTVNFEGCGGTAGYASKTEEEVDGGIDLPFAFVNNDCSKDNWEFAGWADRPVESETDVLTLDLLPPGIHYQPTENNNTLYAVYCRKENTYTKLTSLSNLRLGLSYIIATSGNKALKAQTKDGNYVDYADVSPSAGVITMDNAHAIEWRIQGAHHEYVFFNEQDSLFLDLRTAGKALLQDSAYDNFYLSGASGNDTVRSNMSIVNNSGKKYLHFDGTNNRFDTDLKTNVSAIYFYQQQAAYNSYPLCAEPIEPLRWTGDNHVVLESYVLSGTPRLSGGIGAAAFQEDEGTYCLEYNPSVLTPGSKATISWGDKHVSLQMPYLVTSNTNASTLGAADCSECDYVVLPGYTLTINEDKTVHDITIYEGGTLHIGNGVTLNVHSLILRRDDDTKSPQVTFGNGSSAINLQFDEIYYDIRIDEERYYWFSLPFNAFLQEVSYSNIEANGKEAEYRTDYFVKYYNGVKRAEDADQMKQAKSYWTHVADKGKNAQLIAGRGYEIGIYNQKTITQPDGNRHTKRVMRFTMRPDDARWNRQEIESQKVTVISPSSCYHPLNIVHAGWNLIGNPYLHNYNTGSVDGSCGLINGRWKKEIKDGVWTGYYEEDSDYDQTVPYVTVYDPTKVSGKRYSQKAAANLTLKPFEAVFVQVSEGEQINFAATMNASTAEMPAYRRQRKANYDAPLYTGITLNGNEYEDRTGVVLSETFVADYVIGEDLSKVQNEGGLNLYTFNMNDQELAFNGLSDEDAEEPIRVGITVPENGVYTFAFDHEFYSINSLDTYQLIDTQEGETTDLLFSNYEFYAQKGAIDNRFYLLIRRAKNNPTITTDIDTINDAEKPRKFIRDGQLFIRHDDRIYNASGTQIR